MIEMPQNALLEVSVLDALQKSLLSALAELSRGDHSSVAGKCIHWQQQNTESS